MFGRGLQWGSSQLKHFNQVKLIIDSIKPHSHLANYIHSLTHEFSHTIFSFKCCQNLSAVQSSLLSLNPLCRAPSSSSVGSSALPLVGTGAWTASVGRCSTPYQTMEASWHLYVSCDQSWRPLCLGEASSVSLAPSV